jgi:hypothetical protein
LVLSRRISVSIALTIAALGISCRSGPPPGVDPILAAEMPLGANILAGVNLVRVRASPLRQQLPPAVAAFLEPFGEADSVLIASDGHNYLVLTRGSFRQAPAGATLLERGLAAAGSADWLSAAVSRHRSGAAGASSLLQRAEPLAEVDEIWMVAAGNANLPVSGNGENLNRLLHATEYTTLSVRLTDRISAEVVGMCRSGESAQHLEETVRALVTLAAAGTKRQPAISGLLRRIRVGREDRAVQVTLVAAPQELQPLFGLF